MVMYILKFTPNHGPLKNIIDVLRVRFTYLIVDLTYKFG